jgi:hypothetical protein
MKCRENECVANARVTAIAGDEIGREAPEASERAILAGSYTAARSRDIGNQNRCKLPGLAHGR